MHIWPPASSKHLLRRPIDRRNPDINMEVELFFNTILSLLACASIILTHYPKGLHIMLCLIDAVYVSIALFVKAQSAGIVF